MQETPSNASDASKVHGQFHPFQRPKSDQDAIKRMTNEEIHRWKEQQTERAMRNYKAKGTGMANIDQYRGVQSARQGRAQERDVSSDSDIEAFVDKGVNNAFIVAEKSL